MNSKNFNNLVDETIKQTAELLKSKGSEYASDTDRLINFKKGAEETGLTPLQVAFVYMRKHYDSIATYTKKDAQGLTQTLSEPIEGRFYDLINYCFLMLALLEETHQRQSQKTREALKDVDHGKYQEEPLPAIITWKNPSFNLPDPWPNLPQEEPFVEGCNCQGCIENRGYHV